jgi:hypothetical protein
MSKERLYQPQHVWNNEESHMRTTDVDLIEMADAAVARGHSDILELDVHVVFSYRTHVSAFSSRGGEGGA